MTGRIPKSGIFWLLFGAAYFLLPLAAVAEFSLKEGDGYGFSHYRFILDDPSFRDTLWLSFKLALETIAISLLLFVPTVYWVRLRLPQVRTVIEFLSLLPFVVPPIVLIIGLLNVYSSAPAYFSGKEYGILVAGYVRPLVPIRVPVARRRLSRDRRPHADRGVAEPRRGLGNDALPG